mgnify:CR=1 FL=1
MSTATPTGPTDPTDPTLETSMTAQPDPTTSPDHNATEDLTTTQVLPAPAEVTAATEAATAATTVDQPTVEVVRGPASATIVFGVLCLLTALGVGLGGLFGLRVNVASAGPALIIGAGLLLVVLGFVGLRSDRRTR